MGKDIRIEKVLKFLNDSIPSAYHCVQTISKELQSKGFQYLAEKECWNLELGKSYYFTRNQSTLIAFSIGAKFVSLKFSLYLCRNQKMVLSSWVLILIVHASNWNLCPKSRKKITYKLECRFMEEVYGTHGLIEIYQLQEELWSRLQVMNIKPD